MDLAWDEAMESSITGFADYGKQGLVGVVVGRAAILRDPDRVEERAVKFNKKSCTRVPGSSEGGLLPKEWGGGAQHHGWQQGCTRACPTRGKQHLRQPRGHITQQACGDRHG